MPQLDRTRAETNAIRDVKEKVERMIEGLGSLKIDPEAVDNTKEEAGPLNQSLDVEMEATLNEYS